MDSVLWLITAILMVFNCHASKKLPVFQRIPKRTLYYKTHVNVILKVQRNNDHTLKTKSVCDWFFIILYCVVSKHCRKSDPVYMIWLRTLMMYTLKHTMRWIIHTLKTVYTLKTLYVVIAVMYTYVQTRQCTWKYFLKTHHGYIIRCNDNNFVGFALKHCDKIF